MVVCVCTCSAHMFVSISSGVRRGRSDEHRVDGIWCPQYRAPLSIVVFGRLCPPPEAWEEQSEQPQDGGARLLLAFAS